jgi:glutathione-regulated potassium-efflux system ancillary protein KefG
MGRRVDIDELIDVGEVAKLLGLSHKNSVSTYSKRYSDFPRPVIEFADHKCRLWLRSDMDAWARRAVREGEG